MRPARHEADDFQFLACRDSWNWYRNCRHRDHQSNNGIRKERLRTRRIIIRYWSSKFKKKRWRNGRDKGRWITQRSIEISRRACRSRRRRLWLLWRLWVTPSSYLLDRRRRWYRRHGREVRWRRKRIAISWNEEKTEDPKIGGWDCPCEKGQWKRVDRIPTNSKESQLQAVMESCPGKTVMSGGAGFALGGIFGLFMASVRTLSPM